MAVRVVVDGRVVLFQRDRRAPARLAPRSFAGRPVRGRAAIEEMAPARDAYPAEEWERVDPLDPERRRRR